MFEDLQYQCFSGAGRVRVSGPICCICVIGPHDDTGAGGWMHV